MTDLNRRKFVTIAGASAVAAPFGALITASNSQAAELDPVDPESAQALTLMYVSESETTGQKCSSCSFFTKINGESMGSCPLFQGNAVMSDGWCTAYVSNT